MIEEAMPASNRPPLMLPESIPVPDQIRDLLLNLATGWAPNPFVIETVESVRFSGVDFTDVSWEATLENDRLIAKVPGGVPHARARELRPFPFQGELECARSNGGSVRAADIASVSEGADLAIEFDDWLALEGDEPALWVGRVEGATDLGSGGNLIVEKVRPDGLRLGRSGHLRLLGAYIYYLIQSGDRSVPTWHLLADTGAGAPDREALECDFSILQFVLGRQLRVASFVGVAKDGRSIGSRAGIGSRRNLNRNAVQPVPFERNDSQWLSECWVAILFERMSRAMVSKQEARSAYAMAINSYLDAMTNHVDADYLRLQVALEAFAFWSLRLTHAEERMVVKSKEDWKRWVKANADAIRSLASEGFAESLYNKVMGVYRLSSGRVVPSAFLAFEVLLTPEMTIELEGRDVIVHQGIMASDDFDPAVVRHRVGIIRTLLVALIAKTVGYGGAINGWEVGQLGYSMEPHAWWTILEEDRLQALQTHVAEA